MRKFKSIINRVIIICGVIFIIFTSFLPKTNVTKDTPLTQEQKIELQIDKEKLDNRIQIDINKHIMQTKLDNSKMMVSNMSSKVEYILQTIDGTYSVNHNKSPENNWNDWLVDSKIHLSLKYKAIISIPASKVSIKNDNNGIVYIDYKKEDIQVKSVEIKEYNIVDDKKMFGEKYSNEDIIALIEMSQEDIKSRINNEVKIINKSVKSLESYMTDICKKFKVSCVTFNNTYVTNLTKYEFVKMPNVLYGHDARELINPEYIVIHDTLNKDKTADAMMHHQWGNNPLCDAMAHFYIDDSKVVQTLDTDFVAWHVGIDKTVTDGQKIRNDNSIGVEICLNNFDDHDKMMIAIENTADFVSQLKKIYPDAEVVRHIDGKSTKPCPSIFLTEENYIMEWEDFLSMINK